MRRLRLHASVGVVILLAAATAFGADDAPKPTACPAHRELFRALDEHMVEAETALSDAKLDVASSRQQQILDDLDKLLHLHAGQGG